MHRIFGFLPEYFFLFHRPRNCPKIKTNILFSCPPEQNGLKIIPCPFTNQWKYFLPILSSQLSSNCNYDSERAFFHLCKQYFVKAFCVLETTRHLFGINLFIIENELGTFNFNSNVFEIRNILDMSYSGGYIFPSFL